VVARMGGPAYLEVVHERGHNDVLVAVAVQVGDERRGVHAGGDLRHPAQLHVLRALVAIFEVETGERVLVCLALKVLVAFRPDVVIVGHWGAQLTVHGTAEEYHCYYRSSW
jgi:hypothetical protein